jgi:hypothetical protein
MSAYRGGRHYEDATYLDGSDGELDARFPKLAIVTGYHCLDAARWIASVHNPLSLLGRVHGDGEKAEFTGLYNGRMYRVTVEPDHKGGNEG